MKAPKREMLLPVSGIVVRCGNTADLKSLVLALVLSLGVKIDPELVVETLEKRLERHGCLEERNLHT